MGMYLGLGRTQAMAVICKSELILARSVVAIFWDAAKYLATDDNTVARKARSRLKTKDPEDAVFFTNLSLDLQELNSILENIVESSISIDQAASATIRDLLGVIQEQYLDYSDYSDGSDSEAGKPDSLFVPLKRLIDEFNALGHGTTDDAGRLNWLCGEIRLLKMRSKQRRCLLEMIERCYKRCKPFDKLYPKDSSSELHDVFTSIWNASLFTSAEKFHHTLSEVWSCTCFFPPLHQDAVFSFHATPTSNYYCSAGLIYFRAEEKGSFGWKRTGYEYHEWSASVKASEVTEKFFMPAKRRFDQSLSERIWAALDESFAGDSVCISSESIVLNRGPITESSGTTFSKELPLSPIFELLPSHPVYHLSPKRRMMLSLYLAYAYLHLSGSCWWPYTARLSVRLPDKIDSDAPPSAFFAASLLKDNQKQNPGSQFNFIECLNRDMPSLVALGKLLLELYVGQRVIWDEVESKLADCVDYAFATQIVPVIRACLAPNELHKPEDPCTIRENKRLRNAFIKNVIIPIQYILQYGYQVTVQDIFSTPPAVKPLEITMYRRLKSPSPLVAQNSAQVIPTNFRVHDGQDQLWKFDDESAKDADFYMKQLQDCNINILDSGLSSASSEGDSMQPVKVAILDTGAQISKDQYKHVYEGRLKGCRSWLKTSVTEGEEFPLGTSDEDGHGTHGTSVLLQASQNTGVHVYVAQVFAARHEMLLREEAESDPTIDRISNAIRYAVDVWKVDVISMSFGFPERVKAIESALSMAEQKGVLMLAAASNCGANDRRSWPARDERVLCIYASTGIGNKYPRNPNAMKQKDNFAVLGTSVKALWPNQDEPVRKSGTSTATSICAAITATVISVLRRGEDMYIRKTQRPGQDAKSSRDKYRRKAELLGRASVMAKVLRLMVAEGGIRDGYDYITPWTVFSKERSAMWMIESILNVIDT